MVEDPKVEETAVETETKENAVEVEESTDAGLKQDLNNALTEKPKVEVVTVPNVNV